MMVKLNNLLKSVTLSLLSISSASAAYSNVTSCETQTVSSTSIVSVYGSQYTGVVDLAYNEPAVEAAWGSDIGPVFTIYIPQYKYDLTGLDLQLEYAEGVTYTADSFKLFSGNIGSFVWPGSIYETSPSGLVFDGRTQDPYLKVTVSGEFDASASFFSAGFYLELDVVPAANVQKRDVLTFEISATLANPSLTTSSSVNNNTAATGTTFSSAATNNSATAIIISSTATNNSATATIISSTATDSAATSTSSSGVTSIINASSDVAKSDSGADAAAIAYTSNAPVRRTVIVGRTVTETITSCSDHACNSVVRTAVGTVIETTINETVTSLTTYCPLVKVSGTVTINETVTVVETDCPIVDENATVAITVTNADSTETQYVTLTNYEHVKPSVTSTTVVSSTGSTAVVQTINSTHVNSSLVAEQNISASTSTSVAGSQISVYSAAAAKPGFLTGSVFGVFALALMI